MYRGQIAKEFMLSKSQRCPHGFEPMDRLKMFTIGKTRREKGDNY
jgi:hypothetical protein